MASVTKSPNPPWLDALLASAYPGLQSNFDPKMFPNAANIDPWNKYPVDLPQGAGGRQPDILSPVQAQDPRYFPAPSSAIRPTRNPAAPPVPNPRNVGGAPAPGIPAPVGVNRTANNPNYSLVQYQTPNSQGGRAPIYTAANFGGPQNAGWGMFGQNPQQPQTRQPQPQGALANPQGGGSGLINSIFASLPNDIFDNSQDNRSPINATPNGKPMPDAQIATMSQNYPGRFNMSPNQLQNLISNYPWVQNMS